MTHWFPAQVLLRKESTMSIEMTEEIKRWTAKRKSALVLEIIKGKTTVSEASRQYDLSPSEVEDWIDNATEPTPFLTQPESRMRS